MHGDLKDFISGEGFVNPPGLTEAPAATSPAVTGPVGTPAPSPKPGPVFKFGQMFKPGPDLQGLIKLGRAMTRGPEPEDNPDLPAGYTYLIQFIAHDLSFAQINGVPAGGMVLADIPQGRSPSLDLDCLYGKRLEDAPLYKDKDGRLQLGPTTPTSKDQAQAVYENDLRRDDANKENPRKALIADPRNDDNLVVAQTHVAFTKFHNAVTDLLAGQGLSGSKLFEATRKKVIQHYQWIVLKDFLPRIIDETVLDDAIKGLKFFTPGTEKTPFMPIEFSFAAFRLGHSMVGASYEWNRIFHSPKRNEYKDAAKLHQLFDLTGANGTMDGIYPTLPTRWIIDWTRFYDFPGMGRAANRAKKIGTRLTAALDDVFSIVTDIPKEYRSLPVLDLIRGAKLGLPTGQEVAHAMNASWRLPPGDIAQGPHAGILKDHGFDQRTPLWYYVLREAEFYDVKRLGPVGGRIVAETFIGILRASDYSILDEKDWRPDLGHTPGTFAMADLLLFVREHSSQKNVDELNPLGSDKQ